ncbi:MAG: hypothetical protein KBH73_03670 [Syntrophobacterales bacterium]|nr:hypothetical protein [Syntrophobacterales bacterium]
MKKEADRIRRWRERKKAEGKSSFTVVLSQQAREILAEEKGKTGESYAVIMEKALLGLKRQGYTPPVLRHFPRREEVLARASAQNPPPAPAAGRKGDQPRILIDDLANYPSLEDIEREQAAKEPNGTYDTRVGEGLIARLLRSSPGPFGRRKKWFR